MLPFSVVAVLVAGVFSMVLGFIWYGPMLFAKSWMKEVGLSEKDMKGGPGIGYLVTFVAALGQAAVTGVLVHLLNVTDIAQGATVGLLVGVGYVATTFASNYIFAQKSGKLYFIDAGYQVLNVMAAAIIATLIK